jgi:hypothetical protein
MKPEQLRTAKLFKTLTPLALTSQPAALKRMETMAFVLYSAFVIPGTNQRVGIDAVIGLIPGLGDVVTTALSTYVIWEAKNLGVSRWAMSRLLGNLAVHASIGIVPVLGDAFCAFFRVNKRNMRIIRHELARQCP